MPASFTDVTSQVALNKANGTEVVIFEPIPIVANWDA